MKKYAVLQNNDKQYLIYEGEQVLVDHLPSDASNYKVIFASDGKDVFFAESAGKVKISIDLLDKVERGEKLRVFKYKSKSRYRKTIGFKPTYSKILLKEIKIS